MWAGAGAGGGGDNWNVNATEFVPGGLPSGGRGGMQQPPMGAQQMMPRPPMGGPGPQPYHGPPYPGMPGPGHWQPGMPGMPGMGPGMPGPGWPPGPRPPHGMAEAWHQSQQSGGMPPGGMPPGARPPMQPGPYGPMQGGPAPFGMPMQGGIGGSHLGIPPQPEQLAAPGPVVEPKRWVALWNLAAETDVEGLKGELDYIDFLADTYVKVNDLDGAYVLGYQEFPYLADAICVALADTTKHVTTNGKPLRTVKHGTEADADVEVPPEISRALETAALQEDRAIIRQI